MQVQAQVREQVLRPTSVMQVQTQVRVDATPGICHAGGRACVCYTRSL